jgi:hypothetical protein
LMYMDTHDAHTKIALHVEVAHTLHTHAQHTQVPGRSKCPKNCSVYRDRHASWRISVPDPPGID